MSETTKTTGVQDEAEKEVPETEEPVTEPVEESPEATAGENPKGEKEAEATDEKEAKGKTSFFGKKKKDNKLEQQIEDLTDRLKRNMAEFDNFRKRTEKEKSSMYIIGAKDIIEKILPVVDNFERGLAQAPAGVPEPGRAEAAAGTGSETAFGRPGRDLSLTGCRRGDSAAFARGESGPLSAGASGETAGRRDAAEGSPGRKNTGQHPAAGSADPGKGRSRHAVGSGPGRTAGSGRAGVCIGRTAVLPRCAPGSSPSCRFEPAAGRDGTGPVAGRAG